MDTCIKIAESGGHRYARLAEAYRDDRGISRQRIIANLGRVGAIRSPEKAHGNSMKKLCYGSEALDSATAEFNSALSIGATWLLHSLWNQLGFAPLPKFDDPLGPEVQNTIGIVTAQKRVVDQLSGVPSSLTELSVCSVMFCYFQKARTI